MIPDHRSGADWKLLAFNPIDGQRWTVIVPAAHIWLTWQRGMGPTRELAELVPFVLEHPTAVFRGLRDRESPEGLCYTGLPSKAYDYSNGKKVGPWSGEVYLVFVNGAGAVYTERWEKSAPDDQTLPEGHETRFVERLRYRDDF
jgi:hypothetical protein